MRRVLLPAVVFVASVGCRDAVLVPPRSLDSPSAMAVARGDVCLSTFETTDRVVQYDIGPCTDFEDRERGAIGLIANEQSDRLAVMDLSSFPPRIVDFDPSTPGPNHLEVGRLPVAVAVSPNGTVAYTLNQLDRDISIVELYSPQVLAARFSVDQTPIAFDVDPVSGEVVVAAGSPTRLYGFDGISYCGADEPCEGSPDPEDVRPRTIDLPGTASDLVFSPQGDEAWVVYRDLGYASVVSFGETPDGFDTPCLSGIDSKPCIVANVSLGLDCADGLDNDGDGLVDQQDAQCFGPRGSESPAGLARIQQDACANGLDDDEDGLTDRDDPECAFASGLDEGVSPFVEVPQTACSDMVDNDDDGSVDYPNDASCYGGIGRTEETLRPRGYDAIGIDTHGLFAYVVDRPSEQILVIDARRKKLIDAPAAELPASDALDTALGIDVAPSPLSVQGAIERNLVWVDPDDSNHVAMRYDFGAWVSANNGSLQYVDTVVMFCEFTGDVVDPAAFWRGEQGEQETRCLDLPAFPLESERTRAIAGDETLPSALCLEPFEEKVDPDDPEKTVTIDFVGCVTCLEASEESCEACDVIQEHRPELFDTCQRAYVDDVFRYVNPRFALRDAGGDLSRILGSGTCQQPDELITAMQEFALANPNKTQDLKCNSPLMPQPLALEALELDDDEFDEIDEIGRATLFELLTVGIDTENLTVVETRAYDQRIRTEAVTSTFEGIIPNTQRADGLLAVEAEEDGSIWVDVGFDPCARGVVPGDHFIITAEPLAVCAVATNLEYEVVETTDSALRIAPFEGGTDEVPIRDCFDQGFAYEVRSSDEWLVVGDSSGFLSPFESALGQCVPRYGAERLGSRVRTGQVYEGPYYSFYMFPGIGGDADLCGATECADGEVCKAAADGATSCVCAAGTHEEDGQCVSDTICLANSCNGQGECDDSSSEEIVVCTCVEGWAGEACDTCDAAGEFRADGMGGCTKDDAGPKVAPVRDTSVTFQVSSGFSSRAFPTCSSVGQQCAPGLFPTQVLWVPGLDVGTLLLSPDPNDEFIHVKNLDDSAGGYTVVR